MNRSITAEEFISISKTVTVLDVRRKEDFDKADDIVNGAEWKDPTLIDHWIDSIAQEKHIVIYCARGGGVSNSVVERLIAEGRHAQFVEGGIVALNDAQNILVIKNIQPS